MNPFIMSITFPSLCFKSLQRETKERIWTPYNDYRNFVDNVLKPFKVQPQHNELKNESEALQSRLGEVVSDKGI